MNEPEYADLRRLILEQGKHIMAAFSDVQTSLTNLGAAITAEIAAVTADIQALSAGASPAQLDTIVASLNTLRRLHRLLNTKRVAKPAKANDSPTFFS